MIFDRFLLKPENEQARLAALAELNLLGGERFVEMDRLTALAAEVCNADLSAVTLYDDEDGVRVSVSSGEVAHGPVPRCDTVCTHILVNPGTLIVDDAASDPIFSSNRFVHEPPYLRSYVGVPVAAEQGLPVGVLCVTHREPNAFTQDDVRRLEKIAELMNAFLETRLASIRAANAARKTAEERRRQNMFELIFEAIQEGVNVHTPTGEVVETNAAGASILGLTRGQMQGRAFTDPRWKTFKPDGSSFLPDEYPVAITLRTGLSLQNVPMGIELPSGAIRWITINTAPLRHPETQDVEYAVVTMKDVTEQRTAEVQVHDQNRQLADALAEAEKASRAKTDFMGVMSHELRTPMNAVLSCALLLSQSRLDPVQKRTLGVLEDAGRQMLAVLNDLLDLSSLNAGKVRIERDPVSLVRLIQDAAVIWASDVREKGLTLSVMIDPKLMAPRSVDSARVLQIIGNLMANAIKFTSQGGVTIQAWPETGKGGVELVTIEVEDTGPGVPAEAVERIFSAFEQADTSTTRKHGGLGLGLHVARRLAVAMGGDIELETRAGEGSRFTVRVEAPLSRPDARPAPPPLEAANDADAESREILCVDDNDRNLYVIAAMLRAAGHNPTTCASGAEALEILSQRKFDVVMLDMVMPDMDGLETLAKLREGGGLNAHTPVIACTANVLPDQVEAYRKAGTADVLAKPIDPRAMLRAVTVAA
ncbi:MAG: ATP-binding protein [Hyphomonadaceae bacterium]|nr:ATP-binding protein [Hyphomonadaceae bacterium]